MLNHERNFIKIYWMKKSLNEKKSRARQKAGSRVLCQFSGKKLENSGFGQVPGCAFKNFCIFEFLLCIPEFRVRALFKAEFQIRAGLWVQNQIFLRFEKNPGRKFPGWVARPVAESWIELYLIISLHSDEIYHKLYVTYYMSRYRIFSCTCRFNKRFVFDVGFMKWTK